MVLLLASQHPRRLDVASHRGNAVQGRKSNIRGGARPQSKLTAGSLRIPPSVQAPSSEAQCATTHFLMNPGLGARVWRPAVLHPRPAEQEELPGTPAILSFGYEAQIIFMQKNGRTHVSTHTGGGKEERLSLPKSCRRSMDLFLSLCSHCSVPWWTYTRGRN